MQRDAQKIGAGDFATRAQQGSSDELGDLASAFNKMAEEIESHVARRDEIEASLKSFNAQLEKQVEQWTHELTNARDLAEKANNAKSEFLSSMSHELRTPMNAIMGFTQLLEIDPQQPLSEVQKTSTGHVLQSAEHLLRLIDDVLDFARIEAGNMEVSVEDLFFPDVLDHSLEMVKNMAAARSIKIQAPAPEDSSFLVKADYTRLGQCLMNLLTNGVKYNRKDGAVTVAIAATGAVGGVARVRISITDTGVGIPSEQQAELFQPFSRLGYENSEIEGTGIGLSITKQLVERMGGTIGVESQVDKGSTFWIELIGEFVGASAATELTRLQDEDNADAERKPRSTSSKKILYVEDNPANLNLMEMILSRTDGIDMVSAINAEIGLGMVRTEKPDLILLDINLPGMNGFEALKILKEIEVTAEIPIIAVSAAAAKSDIDRAINAGFDAYLTKPINVQELLGTLKRYLEIE